MMTNPSLLLLSLFMGLMVLEVRSRATHHVSADLSSLAQRHREHRHRRDTTSTEELSLDRQKQLRKNHIRDHIETSLNWKGKRMPTAEEVQARVAELPEMIVPQSTTIAPSPLSGGFVERVQSFHPMCFDDVDEKLLRQLPLEMSHKMSLFFNMRLPAVETGSRLKLIEAKLRLQKQELAQMPSSNYIVTVFILNVTEGGFTPAPTVILDTLMVREFSPGWISLDITAAVDEWRKRQKQDGSLEGALVVEVEDTSQNPVPASDFLSAFPCQPQPIKTRLVVSRDELEQLLEIEEEHEHQRQQQQQVRIEERLDRLASRQEEDEELFRRILSSLMSSEENERVWGRSSN